MTTPAAIILGSALIALGVALGLIVAQLVPRYEFATVAGGALRLDRVTGEIQSCHPYRVGPPPAEGDTVVTFSWQCTPTVRAS